MNRPPTRIPQHPKLSIVLAAVALVCAACAGFFSAPAAAHATESASRLINLVFDDSQSMGEDPHPAAWSQAKYGLEVMAAMLSEGDVLTVYQMSQCQDGCAPMVIQGSVPAAQRVAQVHDHLIPHGGGTPYGAVKAAQSGLSATTETTDWTVPRWLVVFTDGRFQEDASPDSPTIDVARLNDDCQEWTATGEKVYFLGMGDDTVLPTQNVAGGIFSKKVPAGETMSGLTAKISQVFQRAELTYSGGAVDVPLNALDVMVFAEGESVSVGEMTNIVSDKGISPVSAPAAVSYSTNTGTLPTTATYDSTLEGVVAEYHDVSAGTYTLSIADASQVRVFYAPDAQVQMILIDSGSQPWPASGFLKDGDEIPEGAYTMRYGFADSAGNWIDSDVLGTLSFWTTVINGGSSSSQANGAQLGIGLTEGSATIDVWGMYLNQYTAHLALDLTVGPPQGPLDIALSIPNGYTATNLESHGCIGATVTLGGIPITQEQQDSMEPLTVTTDATIGITVTKDDATPAFFLCFTSLGKGYHNPTSDFTITVSGSITTSDKTIDGQASATVHLFKDPPWYDQAGQWLTHHPAWSAVGLLVVIALVGGVVLLAKRAKNAKKPDESA